MTEQNKVTVWGPKEVAHWLQTRVMQQVVPLLPNRERDWPAFEVALRAAVIRDTEFGEGKLQDAIGYNPNAALLGVVKCARLGLSLNPADEHFCMVPYSRVVEGQVMYRGWLHLLNQSGQCEGLNADVVYKREVDQTRPLVDPVTGMVNHVPHAFERDDYPDGDMVGVYAWCKVKGRPRIVSVTLGASKIAKLRALNKGKAPAWNAHPQAMWKAKALKALCRSGMVPLKPQLLADLKELEDDGLLPATVQTPPLGRPSGIVVTVGPSASDNPDWGVDDQVGFDEHDKNPMPSAEDELAIQRKAILALQKQKKVTDAGLALVCKKVVGEAVTLEQLSLESLAQVAEVLRAD